MYSSVYLKKEKTKTKKTLTQIGTSVSCTNPYVWGGGKEGKYLCEMININEWSSKREEQSFG